MEPHINNALICSLELKPGNDQLCDHPDYVYCCHFCHSGGNETKVGAGAQNFSGPSGGGAQSNYTAQLVTGSG